MSFNRLLNERELFLCIFRLSHRWVVYDFHKGKRNTRQRFHQFQTTLFLMGWVPVDLQPGMAAKEPFPGAVQRSVKWMGTFLSLLKLWHRLMFFWKVQSWQLWKRDVPTLSSRGECCIKASQHSLASLHQNCCLRNILVFRHVCSKVSAEASAEGCTYYLWCWEVCSWVVGCIHWLSKQPSAWQQLHVIST